MNRMLSVSVFSLLVGGIASPRAPESVAANDNRRAAGTLKNGVLTVSLETRTGVWRPEGELGRSLAVAAFAERGKELSTPGPLIRVPVGTEVRATIRNTFDKPLTVFGFGKTRGMTDSVIIAAGAEQLVSFKATAPGTFYYAARRELDPFGLRGSDDLQLNGAIVVDTANGPARPKDRVLMISWWETIDPTSKTGLGQVTMTINGLSWPHTERLDYAEGDSIHWRVINMTDLDHPMHLHGFYFRLNSRGNGVTDSLFAVDQRRMAVTEIVEPFKTLSLSWKADRPGNWIYHCHYSVHLSTLVSLDMNKGDMDASKVAEHHMGDAPHQMFGLVMGIRVAPGAARPQLAEKPRSMRILMRQKANVYGNQPGFSFVLGGTADEADPNAMPVPAQPLVLERGRPVSITVVNQSSDHASIHWHGIELESYPDGVPGWSGAGKSILPAINAHDSLTIQFTPPRAGTFMYHSHFNETTQMGGGAYGPIIVVEPGQRFDPEVDKVLFFGAAGNATNVVFGPYPDFIMNGHRQPPDMNLKVGTRYRFRLINLAGDSPLFLSMKSGDSPIDWKFVAKDGFALPPSQIKSQRAELLFDPGEIYDFEYTPTAPGELTLTFGPPPPPPGAPPPPPPPPPGAPAPAPPAFSPPPPTIKVAVHVR